MIKIIVWIRTIGGIIRGVHKIYISLGKKIAPLGNNVPEKIVTPLMDGDLDIFLGGGWEGRRLWKSGQEGRFGPKKTSSGVIFNCNLDLLGL